MERPRIAIEMNVLRTCPCTAYRAGTVLIRLMLGAASFTEGPQQFLYAAVRAAGCTPPDLD